MTSVATYTILVFATIGIYPIFQISAGCLVCKAEIGYFSNSNNLIFNTGDACFGSTHILNIIIFGVIATMHVFIMKTSTMSFFDPNPLSKQPYARMMSDSYILRAIPSVLTPIFSVLDYYGEARIYTLVALASVFLVELLVNLRHPTHYSKATTILFDLSSSLKLGVYITVILNYVSKKPRKLIINLKIVHR